MSMLDDSVEASSLRVVVRMKVCIDVFDGALCVSALSPISTGRLEWIHSAPQVLVDILLVDDLFEES